MDITGFLQSIFLGSVSLISAFWNSSFFGVIKFLLGVYTIILIIDIILILSMRDIKGNLQEGFKGDKIPLVPLSRIQRKWKKARKKVYGKDLSQIKAGIMEADSIVDKVLEDMNCKGKDISERLAATKPGQFEFVEEVLGAHEFRNKILYDESFVFGEKEAQEAFNSFEQFLKNLEFI